MNIEDALYHAVHDYKGGACALAPRMGIAPSTLQSMANPNCETHQWPLHRVRQVGHLTGDVRPLEALCTEFGGIFIKLPPPTTQGLDEVYLDMARLAKEFGDVPREVMQSLQDGKLSQKEFDRVSREVMELQQAGAALLKRLEAMVDTRRPAPFSVAK